MKGAVAEDGRGERPSGRWKNISATVAYAESYWILQGERSFITATPLMFLAAADGYFLFAKSDKGG
ncbi:MAG: hypothetical protein IJ234_09595 [Clostridia bacterium]|nr:hypothetical protein [Clostridia bacterium]